MLGLLGKIFRRTVSALPAIAGIVTLTFILMRILPGDPAVFFSSSPGASREEVETIRTQLGLDKPLPVQFLIYLGDLATGNLGKSLTTGQPVARDLSERLPASLELALAALVLALIVALPMGVIAALRQGSVFDHFTRLIYTVGSSTPSFVSGLLLVFVFYHLLGWAPDPVGRLDIFLMPPPRHTGFLLIDAIASGDGEVFLAALRQLVLPAATIALFVIAPLSRMTRGAMLGILTSPFIRTATSMGLSPFRVVVVYALRNALLPILTTVGVVFSAMLSTSVLVEKVFSWPGISSYALDAFLASDYAPVQGFVLLMALMFSVINLTIDLLYTVVDPRIALE